MNELNWSDEQWQMVNAAVTEAFDQASVTCSFLPMYGPVAGSTEIVRNERLTLSSSATGAGANTALPPTIRLDRDHLDVNLRLVNVAVNVELSTEQVTDGSLSNAILAFVRAANILAQEQDRIVFEGYRQSPLRSDANSIFVTNNPEPQRGLADLPARLKFFPLPPRADAGPATVTAVVRAVQGLEDNFNPAPFACVLGNKLFEAVHTPNQQSLVLPADRITPLLRGGPLMRSGRINTDVGIVVSLPVKAVDIVVGKPPGVQFLQRTAEAKFLFRVYERFVLRIRDAARPPVVGFRTDLAKFSEERNASSLAEAENLATRIEKRLTETDKGVEA